MEESLRTFAIIMPIFVLVAFSFYVMDYIESIKIIKKEENAEKFEYCTQIDNLYYCYKKVEE